MSDPIDLTIRPATFDDVAVIVEFNRRLAWESEGKRLDPETLQRGVRGLLGDPLRGAYSLADVGGRVVGQLMRTFEWSDWRNGVIWWLQSVYVDPEFRSRGVFRTLFEHLQTEALATDGVVGLRLYVEQENASAQEVYRKLGMREGGYLVMEWYPPTVARA